MTHRSRISSTAHHRHLPRPATGLVLVALSLGLLSACGPTETLAPETPKAVLSDFNLAFELKEGTRETAKTFSVLNSGKGSLDIESVKIGGDAEGAFVVRTTPILPATIKPGKTLKGTVTFRPPLTKSFEATATIASNDPRFPSIEMNLKGAVIARVVCRSDDPCQRAVLDEKTGRCSFKPRSGSCDDKQECTKKDRCLDGVCIGVPTQKCYEGPGACIPGECDAAQIPMALMDKDGRLRQDWKKVLSGK